MSIVVLCVAYLCFVVMIHIYIYIRTRRRLWVCWYQIKSFSPFDTTFISFIFVTLPFFFCLIIMCLEYMAIFCELSSIHVSYTKYIYMNLNWCNLHFLFYSVPSDKCLCVNSANTFFSCLVSSSHITASDTTIEEEHVWLNRLYVGIYIKS